MSNQLFKQADIKVLVVGGGGREHAIISKLRQSPRIGKIFAAPGNGGIAALAECVEMAATDLDALTAFALQQQIDFCVVAPDDPLVLGLVDRLHELGIPCFGPEAKAAIIEGSKSFAKQLMQKYDIPTAAYAVFDDAAAALAYVQQCPIPVVLKADGLALGKGVIIAETRQQAIDGVKRIMEEKAFGSSGDRLVVEEFLQGPEVSVLAFTDGKSIVPMVSSMDHKRALDGDRGLNTGGMGTIAPNPCYTQEIAAECMQRIFLPTVRGMAAEGRAFKGCLYFGLMLTSAGPKVIEYNCRFGDPETQVVLPLLQTDLLEIMLAVEEERLHEIEVVFAEKACCCVVLASGGYPEAYQKGFAVQDNSAGEQDVFVFHAGTALKDGQVVTSGGRVLGVTAVADDLPAAIKRAYQAVEQVSFEGAYWRRDIGARALL